MLRFVYVVNGPGHHGKDTFISFVLERAGQMNFPGYNFSSIDPCRVWVHEKHGVHPEDKSEEARKLLVAEKQAWMGRDPEGPNRYLLEQVTRVQCGVVFLHIREPEQIAALQQMALLPENGGIRIKTGHVIRPGKPIPENPIDQGTLGPESNPFQYDFYIENDRTEVELRESAYSWADEHIFTPQTVEGIRQLYIAQEGTGIPPRARR